MLVGGETGRRYLEPIAGGVGFIVFFAAVKGEQHIKISSALN